MGVLKIMDGSGHSTQEWAPPAEQKTQADKDRQAHVNAEFDRMVAAGFMAVEGRSPDATQIKEFNPEAEEITFVPPLQGG